MAEMFSKSEKELDSFFYTTVEGDVVDVVDIKLQKVKLSPYKFRKVCSLEHFYILRPVGTNELWPA
jgi:hypothetical protein